MIFLPLSLSLRSRDARRSRGNTRCLRRPKDANLSFRALKDIKRKDFQGVRQLTFSHAEGLAKRVLEMFEAGEFDVVTLYFSEFKSVITQKPTALQLIPATVSETAGEAGKGGAAPADVAAGLPRRLHCRG
jgi:F0F1-type ATP synthase gamma subunit